MQKINKLMIVIFFGMILLSGCSRMEIISEDVILELGTNPETCKENFIKMSDGKIEDVIFDFSKVKYKKEGTYEACATFRKRSQSFHITIRDTVAPRTKVKSNVTVRVDEKISAKDVVKKLDEKSGSVKVSFEEGKQEKTKKKTKVNGVCFQNVKISYDTPGNYKNVLVVEDEAGNKNQYDISITVKEIEEKNEPDVNIENAIEKKEEATNTETDWVADLSVAQRTNQLIVVAAKGTSATVSMHTKDSNGNWTQILTTNGFVGRDGVGQASEYSACSPCGVWGFCSAFGNAPNPGSSMSYIQVDDSYYWVDDINSSYYNKFVSTRDVIPDWNSAEHISACGAAYNYVLALDYNAACIPGNGSAFFLHCSTGRPTMGCVSVPTNMMVQILQQIQPGCLIIIDTEQGVYNY